MITRIRVVVAMFVAPLFSSIHGQTANTPPQQDSSNLMCIEKMELPSYPLLAQQAQISGTIMVDATLSATGSVQNVSVRADPKLSATGKGVLEPPVLDVIRGAAFNRRCADKTVSVVFVFEIAGTSLVRPKQTVAFGSPNRFWIKSEAPHFQP
jgi:TonB family protein